jgi:hypothetical protein
MTRLTLFDLPILFGMGLIELIDFFRARSLLRSQVVEREDYIFKAHLFRSFEFFRVRIVVLFGCLIGKLYLI